MPAATPTPAEATSTPVPTATSRPYLMISPPIGPFGGPFGQWESLERCPFGQWAVGVSLKIEASQGGGDDTALNGIQLRCGAPTNVASATISSGVGGWGSWTNWIQCDNGFINRATLRIEPSQGGGDDTGAVDADFYCSSGTRLWHSGPHFSWGDWKTLQSCPDGTAICGLQTKVERDQGGGDDTALNDVTFYCCSLP